MYIVYIYIYYVYIERLRPIFYWKNTALTSHDVLIPALTLPDCWWLGKCGQPQIPGAAVHITSFCIVALVLFLKLSCSLSRKDFSTYGSMSIRGEKHCVKG